MNDLDSSRFLLENFIELNAEAILIVDKEFRVVGWNKRMEVLTGKSREEVISASVTNILSVWDFDFAKYTEAAFFTQSYSSSEIYNLYTNSEIVTVSPSFSPLNAEEEPLCMIMLKEVSKEQLGAKYQSLVAESPVATAIFLPGGKMQYFNPAYARLWDMDDKMGMEMLEKYNILDDDQLLDLGIMPFVQKGFGGETSELPPTYYDPADTKSWYKNKIGEKKYVRGHIYPVKNNLGIVKEVVIVLSDITFQKQAEQILTDTHLKFQMLTLGLPGVIYELEELPNGEERFRYISHGCEEMFDLTSEEVRSDASLLEGLIHPLDKQSYLKSTLSCRNKVKEWQWEGRLLVNGKEKWIEGRSSPARKKGGSVIRYGLLLDITDKKLAQKRYRLSEERLHVALQGAELALWEWKVNGKKIIFNKSWIARLGYEPGELELTLEEWSSYIHPDDVEETIQKLNDHMAGLLPYYEAEYRFRTKNEGYRWLLVRGRVVERYANNRVKKVCGTYLDIDEKKRSEILSQRNELLFTQLFDNSPLGIVLLDESHSVMQVNQGFKNMFGFSDEEVIGNQLNSVLVPPELMQEAKDINTLTASGQVGLLESFRLHSDGHTVPVIIYGVPVSLKNETIGIYGIYVDITERTEVEHELQIRNNELDNFVYKVSHDLRAPLSSILGLVNLAGYEENEDDIRQYISLIENRVKQLDSFINDVLSHSKNLKLAITVEAIDFNQIVSDCFTNLNYLPKAKEIQKKIEISDHAFYSDKWRINEIFRNLISNAIKYLDPEKEMHYVKIEIGITDEMAHIRFEDNGIGIEESILSKVFEMFYRATEYSEGSGIGLYIVKNAIEKLGGEIRLRSKLHVGSTFDIMIPNKNPEG
ncbi:PAS domain S-box protein [Fulvivirga maritima]|uniref:PAS domain-containing sensor histidine kinase n=1 Tax=Fulvivirga maritima TaxID=2904247 RepID=UPI001F43F846|nr:PAS domain-containing sensor histidine kinase [Fulvivirga maritima]UII28511.1 PAS domain S-box protein [Fulvivirga maritima]